MNNLVVASICAVIFKNYFQTQIPCHWNSIRDHNNNNNDKRKVKKNERKKEEKKPNEQTNNEKTKTETNE